MFFKNPFFLFILLVFSFLTFFQPVYALGEAEEAKQFMSDRQQSVRADYDNLSDRVQNLDSNNPRKDPAKDLLKTAREAVDAFYSLIPDEHLTSENRPDKTFEDAETEAVEAINTVNRYLFAPVQPGVKGIAKEGTVPKGDLMTDFIPQFIRLLMRFASLVILVTFVVSGVMFVASFGNDERVTQAKRMLYYSLMGFAFVVLAFAIIKAVTDIDFFGFV